MAYKYHPTTSSRVGYIGKIFELGYSVESMYQRQPNSNLLGHEISRLCLPTIHFTGSILHCPGSTPVLWYFTQDENQFLLGKATWLDIIHLVSMNSGDLADLVVL